MTDTQVIGNLKERLEGYAQQHDSHESEAAGFELKFAQLEDMLQQVLRYSVHLIDLPHRPNPPTPPP